MTDEKRKKGCLLSRTPDDSHYPVNQHSNPNQTELQQNILRHVEDSK